MEILNNVPTYFLLTSEKIRKVIGVSSSVLYEAQFFGKEIEYLYKPLFNIDQDFGLNNFVSVNGSYFNPYFWSDILSIVMDVNETVPDEMIFANTKNKLRDLGQFYWGYKHLEMSIVRKPKTFLQRIFSISYVFEKGINRQIITILGLKIKIRRKKNK